MVGVGILRCCWLAGGSPGARWVTMYEEAPHAHDRPPRSGANIIVVVTLSTCRIPRHFCLSGDPTLPRSLPVTAFAGVSTVSCHHSKM